jgi:anti-sigma factor RsiW
MKKNIPLFEPASRETPNARPLGSIPERRKRPFFPVWSIKSIAVLYIIAILSSIGGWAAHDYFLPVETQTGLAALPRLAAIAHVVYSPDIRRPVEVGAEHEDQLVAWLSKRLGTDVRPPKLGSMGFELIGGRLLPGNSGPVAQFMYHDTTGQRLTLYVSPEKSTANDSAFRYAQEGPVNVYYWLCNLRGYCQS